MYSCTGRCCSAAYAASTSTTVSDHDSGVRLHTFSTYSWSTRSDARAGVRGSPQRNTHTAPCAPTPATPPPDGDLHATSARAAASVARRARCAAGKTARTTRSRRMLLPPPPPDTQWRTRPAVRAQGLGQRARAQRAPAQHPLRRRAATMPAATGAARTATATTRLRCGDERADRGAVAAGRARAHTSCSRTPWPRRATPRASRSR